MKRFFYKHLAFKWEREFRLAISLEMASGFGVPVPKEEGIFVGVDLDALVECVYIGPELTATDQECIHDSFIRVGIKPKLAVSSLLGRPRYL